MRYFPLNLGAGFSTRAAALAFAVAAFLLATAGTARCRAGEEREPQPDFFRVYRVSDLAECLAEFKEREFFECIYGRVFTDDMPEDQFMLGLLYEHGLGTPRDAAKAAHWRGRGEAGGYSLDKLGEAAVAALADLNEADRATEPEAPELSALEAAARDGTGQEQLRLATLYWRGLCAPLDWEEAKEWEIRAAEQGDPEAREIVAFNFSAGDYAYPRDLSQAVVWLEPLTAEGNVDAAVYMGDIYCQGTVRPRDYAKALELYEMSAAGGNRLAVQRLRHMYREGLGVEPDPEKLAELDDRLNVRKLVDDAGKRSAPRPLEEYAREIYQNGLRHYTGDGVPVDYYQAGLLFADAAGLGVHEGENHFLLGHIQENGVAGAPNSFGAGKSYRIAALLGHGPAMARLAVLHEKGQGVRRSRERAEYWHAKAKAAGVADD